MKRTRQLLKATFSQLLALIIGLAMIPVPAAMGQKTGGSNPKMTGGPQAPSSRDIDSTAEQLSDPRSGVIVNAKVRQNKAGQVRSVEGNVAVPDASTAREAADKFLDQNADKLGIMPLVRSRDDKTGLRVVNEIESLTGTHLTYKQFYDDLPVFDQQIKVSVNKKLQVTTVTNDVKVVPESRDILPPDNKAAAILKATGAVQGTADPRHPATAELGIVMNKGKDGVATYRVTIATIKPIAEWIVMVNARTLSVVSIDNVLQYETAPGKIFRPNPVNSSGNANLDNRNNASYPELTAQMKQVVLRDLNSSGTLSGTYANTTPTSNFVRAKRTAAGFNFDRSDNRFDEVMAYYWVTEATHYVHELGMTNVLNDSMGINVDGILCKDDPDGCDNSFFDPITKQLTFGEGGVHDAQDAQVIVHEFGHALQNAQVPGFGGRDTEAGAIGEGFGDYWAASTFAGNGAKGNAWNTYIFTWDAMGMDPKYLPARSSDSPFYERRIDKQQVYPRDLDPNMEVHNNGEIWSSHLWEIWKALGKKTADTLIVEANFKLSPKATFKENAEAIIKTDGELNGGRNVAVLRNIFTRRGILSTTTVTSPPVTPGGGDPSVTTLADQKWTGKDALDITFNYQFASDGKASVATYFKSTDKTYTDPAATYTVNNGQVKITIFNGLFVQIGTIEGDQIKGTSVLTLNKQATGANAKTVMAMKKLLSNAKSDSYAWTASRADAAPTSMVNQKWSGKDAIDIAYNYTFGDGGKAAVSVYFKSLDKTYTDSAATWQRDGNTIKINVFSGLFVQTGTIQGDQITGNCIVTTSKRNTGASAKLVATLKRSVANAKGDTYTWTASRIE